MQYGDNRIDGLSVSNALVAACAGVTLLSWIVPALAGYGLWYGDLLAGDYARLAGSAVLFQFLHGGVLHLLGNSIFLVYFGNTVERMMGRDRYVAFFAWSTIVVTGSILAFSGAPTVGMSGFTMAVLAYLAMELRAQRHPDANTAFAVLALNIFIGFSPGVSLVGHAGGAVAGLLASVIPKSFRRFH